MTFLLERGGERSVLRRPPRPPLPPSAHDMLREARVLQALQGRARVPRVLAVCDDASVLDVPFYVMEELRGHVVDRRTAGRARLADATGAPPGATGRCARRAARGGHRRRGAAGFGRPDGYLERQLRRFAALWEHNATRELPLVGRARRTGSATPCRTPAGDRVVHGDYRLGNVMLERERPRVLGAARLGARDARRSAGRPRLSRRDLHRCRLTADGARPLAGDAQRGLPEPSRAGGALRRAERPHRRQTRLVRGAGPLEGGSLLRGPLRPLPARRNQRALVGKPGRRRTRAPQDRSGASRAPERTCGSGRTVRV